MTETQRGIAVAVAVVVGVFVVAPTFVLVALWWYVYLSGKLGL